MQEISESTKNLAAKYDLWQKSLKPKGDVKTLHVDEVASRVAAFYEQIRTIIDWKEEHLMRRAAIIRKLKRRFLDLELNNFSTKEVAESLVLELIRGGFFPNDKIEEGKVVDVQRIVDKYIFILKNNSETKKEKSGLQFYNQLLEIAACEIEETLAPSIKEMASIDFMFNRMKEQIKVNENVYERSALKKEDKDIQIYIAVQQALFKLDNPIISYNLLKYKYSYWDNPSEEELFKISQNIQKIMAGIEQDLNHPIAKKFYLICEKYDTPYLLLGDILSQDDPEKIVQEIADPQDFEALIKSTYTKRLSDLKVKITRAAIYSTTSIFVTKILSLVILEFILARILKGHLNFASILADVLIPTALMAFLVTTVRRPSKKNLHLAVIETMKIAYRKEKIDYYEIKIARKRSLATRLFLSFIYLFGATLSFGAIIGVFLYFAFPITSIIINLIFIALILFAGNAVRKRSKELTIEEESEGLLGFFSDVLFLPMADVGRWMSNTWKQYNAIAAFFNAMIDMPFLAFIEFLERWRYFIKEKKEEM